MMDIRERTLDGFLQNYRIISTAVEAVDSDTQNLLKTIFIRLEQKEQTPSIICTRGIIPFVAPSEDRNLYLSGITLRDDGISLEYSNFYAGVTYLRSKGIGIAFNDEIVNDGDYRTIGYRTDQSNMYGAFKKFYDSAKFLQEYPVFYTIDGSGDPLGITAWTENSVTGGNSGAYTIVNFSGVKTPFQLMRSAEEVGISHSNGLPIGNTGSPLFYGLETYVGITNALESFYYTPDVHTALRRSLNLYLSWGVTFNNILANFDAHSTFVKFADDEFVDGYTGIISQYIGSSASPGWNSELIQLTGTASGMLNLNGFNLANTFLNKFYSEIKKFPRKYKFEPNAQSIGHLSFPYTTETMAWSAQIPIPGTATDATGPYAFTDANLYLNRLAGLTLYPPPNAYNYLGTSGGSGEGGTANWNLLADAIAGGSGYHSEYLLHGFSLSAAATGQSSSVFPINVLKFFNDTSGPLGPNSVRLNFLDSYYHDLYQESLKYGGYRDMNIYGIHFMPKFNPFVPEDDTPTRRCTIHPNFGATASERLFNLEESMKESIQSAMKMWKFNLDNYGKFFYRIMPVISPRNMDDDVTRGGSVPFAPQDFVDYIIAPLFPSGAGVVPANGFILHDDINERLINDFFYGNFARGSAEYTNIVTNAGASGSPSTSFIRGLETYFFDLEELRTAVRFPFFFTEATGLTAAAAHIPDYINYFDSGRFSDFRVFETNTGMSGGNTKIPYGFAGEFFWYLIPINDRSILWEELSLRERWVSTTNNNIFSAYSIIRDAYFLLIKRQLEAALKYFADNKITTLVEYRDTDKFVGR